MKGQLYRLHLTAASEMKGHNCNRIVTWCLVFQVPMIWLQTTPCRGHRSRRWLIIDSFLNSGRRARVSHACRRARGTACSSWMIATSSVVSCGAHSRWWARLAYVKLSLRPHHPCDRPTRPAARIQGRYCDRWIASNQSNAVAHVRHCLS